MYVIFSKKKLINFKKKQLNKLEVVSRELLLDHFFSGKPKFIIYSNEINTIGILAPICVNGVRFLF